jgi:hypothetical protein
MVYVIQATSRYGKENIDTAKDKTEAEYLTEEYAIAFGPSFRITYQIASSISRNGKRARKAI